MRTTGALRVLLFVIIAQSAKEDMRSVRMSTVVGRTFRCAVSTCPPFATVIVSNLRRCSMACLAQIPCQAVTFQQLSFNCELFAGISSQPSNLSANANVVTLIAMSGTRVPPEPTTTSTTSTSTTTITTTTVTTSVTTLDAAFAPSTATCNTTAAPPCADTASPARSCQSYEVSWNNRCYYLDGAGGYCSAGYTKATKGMLTCIASLFAGKTYRSTVSDNCCVWTADTYQCYGLGSNCNSAGPFVNGPFIGGGNCVNEQNNRTLQLTFCGSI